MAKQPKSATRRPMRPIPIARMAPRHILSASERPRPVLELRERRWAPWWPGLSAR